VEEIIIDGQTGYIIKDVDDAVEVLRQIMADDRLLGYLSHNARQLVRERYNIERSAREFLELWQEKG